MTSSHALASAGQWFARIARPPFRPCYTTVAAAGKQADSLATRLLLEVVKPLVRDAPRLTLALNDTPTPRYGPHVQGAGIHHNPTPGPANTPYVFGPARGPAP